MKRLTVAILLALAMVLPPAVSAETIRACGGTRISLASGAPVVISGARWCGARAAAMIAARGR